MADGRTRQLADLRVGDKIVGTREDGKYRRFVETEVLAKWSSIKPAWEVQLEDGTKLLASGDHRFLSDRGWKHVVGAEWGPTQRPHLTENNRLLGPGGCVEPPVEDFDYKRGYLTGMVRGDGTLGSYRYARPNGRRVDDVTNFVWLSRTTRRLTVPSGTCSIWQSSPNASSSLRRRQPTGR